MRSNRYASKNEADAVCMHVSKRFVNLVHLLNIAQVSTVFRATDG